MRVHIGWDKYPHLTARLNTTEGEELKKLIVDIIGQARRSEAQQAHDYLAAYALPPKPLTPAEIDVWRNGILQTFKEWL